MKISADWWKTAYTRENPYSNQIQIHGKEVLRYRRDTVKNMAANTSLLKITQFSKDMNMKSKEVLEVLSDKGIALKASSTLEPQQFELLLNTLTVSNQIDNIGDYLDGVTHIPSKKKAASAEKPAEKWHYAEPGLRPADVPAGAGFSALYCWLVCGL